MPQPEEIAFEGFTLDLVRGVLRDSGGEIALRPKGFEALRHLATNVGRLLSKDELASAVWGKANVSDESLARCVSDIRAALRDQQGRIIATVPRRGYRFSAQVLMREKADAPVQQSSAPRFSVVVLPFTTLSRNPGQEYFADGVTESLTTDLSRIRGAFVIGRNTAFTYKGRAVDLKQIGRELNVRYILEGAVHRSGNRMRVNVQLIDAETGHHLWAERFDKAIADLFDMQDEIVSRLAAAVSTELITAEARRAERSPSPDSTDLYFQGLALLNKGVGPDNVRQARALYARALSLDPGNIGALVGMAAADLVEGISLYVVDSSAAFHSAEAKLEKVLSVVPDHARGHMWLGAVYLYTKRATKGIAQSEHALSLDRNLSYARAIIGMGKLFVGRAEETEDYVLEALRFSPQDSQAYAWMTVAGVASNALGRFERAIFWLRRAIEANRNYPHPHFSIGAALLAVGRADEARSAIKAGLSLNPSFNIARSRAVWMGISDNPTYLSQAMPILELMRQAGVPER